MIYANELMWWDLISESDVYRRQTQMYKDGPRAEKFKRLISWGLATCMLDRPYYPSHNWSFITMTYLVTLNHKAITSIPDDIGI